MFWILYTDSAPRIPNRRKLHFLLKEDKTGKGQEMIVPCIQDKTEVNKTSLVIGQDKTKVATTQQDISCVF